MTPDGVRKRGFGMTSDEIAGRLVALEVFSMAALGLYLANSRNDPDYSKANAILEHVKRTIASTARTVSPAAKAAADQYADQLIATLKSNLRTMREEGGRPH
jgi:hypothetical protein